MLNSFLDWLWFHLFELNCKVTGGLLITLALIIIIIVNLFVPCEWHGRKLRLSTQFLHCLGLLNTSCTLRKVILIIISGYNLIIYDANC